MEACRSDCEGHFTEGPKNFTECEQPLPENPLYDAAMAAGNNSGVQYRQFVVDQPRHHGGKHCQADAARDPTTTVVFTQPVSRDYRLCVLPPTTTTSTTSTTNVTTSTTTTTTGFSTTSSTTSTSTTTTAAAIFQADETVVEVAPQFDMVLPDDVEVSDLKESEEFTEAMCVGFVATMNELLSGGGNTNLLLGQDDCLVTDVRMADHGSSEAGRRARRRRRLWRDWERWMERMRLRDELGERRRDGEERGVVVRERKSFSGEFFAEGRGGSLSVAERMRRDLLLGPGGPEYVDSSRHRKLAKQMAIVVAFELKVAATTPAGTNATTLDAGMLTSALQSTDTSSLANSIKTSVNSML